MDLIDSLRRRAEQGGWLDATAFTEEGRDVRLSHRQVLQVAESLASVLLGSGVEDGQPIALLLGDRLEWPVAFLACARAGALAVLVNPDLSRATLEELYQLGGVTALLVQESGTVRLVDHPSGAERAAWSLTDALTSPSPSPCLQWKGKSLDAPLYLQFSSGTTGHHKGVLHRGADLEAFHRSVGEDALLLTPDDVLYSVSQLYFTYGFNNQFVYPMLSGCSAILRPVRRQPDEVAEAVHRLRPTIIFSVPSSLALTAKAASANSADSPIRLRAIVSAGEKLPSFVEDSLGTVFGTPVLEQIGCTEVGNAICTNGLRHHSAHSCGFPCRGLDVEVRTPDDPEAASAAAPEVKEVGDLWVRTDTIPHKARTIEGTVALTDAQGWLRTGDLAHWNEDGALVVVGRSDDMLMHGGISVSALHVEQIMRLSGLLTDAALTSLVGADGKSFLAALVVPAADVEWEVIEKELSSHCREHLDRFCVPRHFLQESEIPRTPSGKIRRHHTRIRAEARLSAGKEKKES